MRQQKKPYKPNPVEVALVVIMLIWFIVGVIHPPATGQMFK